MTQAEYRRIFPPQRQPLAEDLLTQCNATFKPFSIPDLSLTQEVTNLHRLIHTSALLLISIEQHRTRRRTYV